jgi:FixJ family two-component response regulator
MNHLLLSLKLILHKTSFYDPTNSQIVFTARSNVGAQVLKEGANGFVAKPFRLE